MKYRYREDSELKDSGIEWLGKVPKDWNTPKISSIIETLTDYVANGSFESLAKNVNYLSEEDYAILIRTQDNSNGFKGPFVYIDEKAYNFLSKSKVYPNDIIISNVGAVGNVFKAPNLHKPMSLAPNSILIRTTQNNQYIYYLLQSSFSQEEIRNIVSSTAQPKFNKTNFKGIRTIIPNEIEQEKIANFLDEKISQFDLIISKKEELIQKLDEAKKSLISEVVTGKVKVVKSDDGYDLVKRSSEEMKDSGVEWLGEIPKDWEVSKIKYNCDINKLTLSENTNENYQIKYIDIGSVSSNGEITNIQNFIFKDTPSRARRIVKDKDILISTVRTYLKAITSIDKAESNLICSTGFAVLTPNEMLDYKFLSYFVRCNIFIDEIVSRSTGVSYPAITSSEIANLEIIRPNKLEQITIGKFISLKIDKINNIIKNVKIEIEKLKEAKQSLISEVVTGKIEILD